MSQTFSRRTLAYKMRKEVADNAYLKPDPEHLDNGEEADYRNKNYIANYSKGLPHNNLGEVDPKAYRALLRAITSGNPDDFENIPLGMGRKLVNPQAGLAFDLEGPNNSSLKIRPAPRIDGTEAAAEMAELYWMALCRDIHFRDFDNDQTIGDAIADLEDQDNYSNYTGPKPINRSTIFRGYSRGDLRGPYISQFLLKGSDDVGGQEENHGYIKYGSLRIDQRQWTVAAETDYLTDYDDWLQIQNGFDPTGGVTGEHSCGSKYDDSPAHRFIINMRDLVNYVRFDDLPQPFANACLILIHMKVPCAPFGKKIFSQNNPYLRSHTQVGFGTFGEPHILSLLHEVVTRALKSTWFQKWFVHRRLRPEEFGGLIHKEKKNEEGTSGNRPSSQYPRYSFISKEILNSEAAKRVGKKYNGSYLLPQAYPEGSPTHPSYCAGHAAVAGACVTILKAFFDESVIIHKPVIPNQKGDALDPYKGPDHDSLSVGDELNKLASNVAIGRNMAGVHYRSDYVESIKLGEEVAIGILKEQKIIYNENATFTITKFDGKTVTV